MTRLPPLADLALDHRFAVNGGVRLHYAACGDAGPPLVMIHGFPDFWFTWRYQLPALAHRYRLAATPVLIEVAAPRQPCERLAAKLGQPRLVALIKATGHSGCYLRVHGECDISVGDTLTLCDRLPTAVTLAEANQVLFRQRRDQASLLRVLSVPTLDPDFRHRLEKRLRPT